MILVVGAAAVDLVAVRDAFVPGTSNPSSIRLSAGGVGYNVFRSLRSPARFLTAVGRDPLSDWLAARLAEDPRVRVLGVDLDAPPLYAAFMEKGRLLVGASDLRATERIGADSVEPEAEALGPEDFLVLDANLAPELTRTLCGRYGGATRVVFEPVSREKAARHRGLRNLFLATPNGEEAASLAEAAGRSGEGGWEAWLREDAPAHLVVKRGAAGLEHFRREGPGGSARAAYAPRKVSAATDTTGAGDRLLAGILDALQEGLPMEAALRGAMDAVERRLEGGEA